MKNQTTRENAHKLLDLVFEIEKIHNCETTFSIHPDFIAIRIMHKNIEAVYSIVRPENEFDMISRLTNIIETGPEATSEYIDKIQKAEDDEKTKYEELKKKFEREVLK